MHVLHQHSGLVHTLSWSPDGAMLASADADGAIVLWRVADWRPLVTLSGHTQHIWKVCWDRDGQRLLSVGHDGTVRIWSAAQLREVCRLSDVTQRVALVAWSPDGTIISGYAAGGVRLWSAADGRLLHTFADARLVTWAPGGQALASVGSDSAIRLWKIER